MDTRYRPFHLRLLLVALCGVLSLLLLGAGTASAQQSKGWSDGAAKPLTPAAFKPVLSDEEAYIERYAFSMDLDGGGWIGAYWTISNLGFGNGHGVARLRVKLPNAKKKEYEYFQKVGRDEWSCGEEGLAIDIAGMKLEAKSTDTILMRLDDPEGKMKLELEITNHLPMWQPGRGRIDVDGGGYLAYGLLSPRGSVKGRVFVDGEWHEVAGTRKVFGDHSATNVAPFEFADDFAHFRAYQDDLTIAWREIRLSEKYGKKSFTWMMVGYKDEIVFSDASATLRTADTKLDGDTGYTIPYTVQVDGKTGKDSVKIILRSEKMRREDLLDKYGSVAKLVAGAVSKPYRYEFPSKFTAQLIIKGAKAQVSGKGTYYFDFMKP